MKKTITMSLFWLVQASSLLVLFVPFSVGMVGLWAVSHFLRAIGLTLTYHRYFAHRAFKMGRVTQFVWSWIAASAMQKGPLWWAGHHVTHHKFADREGDPHSPIISGFYHAHLGWFLNDVRHDKLPPTNPVIRDFGKYPEIRLLDEYYWVPPALLALGMYLYGSRRFDTVDESRNNVFTAFFAAGEGWHNNHHRYQRAARNGFYWWEFDPTWYVIKAMSLVGLAWDLQAVPERIYREAHSRPSARVDPEVAEAKAAQETV